MGRIGQKIAKIAKSLGGMIIHYHNRSKLSEDKEQGATYHDSLEKSLFSVSDVLSGFVVQNKRNFREYD